MVGWGILLFVRYKRTAKYFLKDKTNLSLLVVFFIYLYPLSYLNPLSTFIPLALFLSSLVYLSRTFSLSLSLSLSFSLSLSLSLSLSIGILLTLSFTYVHIISPSARINLFSRPHFSNLKITAFYEIP